MSSDVLEELATEVGVIPEYLDQTGRETRKTSDATRQALLGALGIDATTETAARRALAELRRAARGRLIEPVRVVEIGGADLGRLTVRAPASRVRTGAWRLDVELEDGATRVLRGDWRGTATIEIAVPGDFPLGYHRLEITLLVLGVEWSDEQTLIVVPPRCLTADDIGDRRSSDRKAFGLIANLYTLRSSTNWGVGDFSDLAALAEWGGGVGADFVGVNPLHALLNRGGDISPYSPVSRLFRNPVYIDVARVPELEHAAEVRRVVLSPEVNAQLEALRETADVRYEQVMGAKGLALGALHRVFREHVHGTGSPRDAAYAGYVAAMGESLDRFATWMAIAEVRGRDWHAWPAELRRPDSPAVGTFADAHRARVDLHKWLQFEADRQLAEAAARARAAGMRIGLYQDLAIGTSAVGADVWAFPALFVRGVSIGAPPDPYAPNGQNWGLPPIDPRALYQDRYRYFVQLVRSGFRHAGALRIDHVMGLFRLFWIPEGKTGKDGAYVSYPWRDLLGIVALESVRNGALVVGEDLGTVPPDVPPALEKWGVLSSKVLYFEREHDGRFKSAASYPSLALATANTHDMPTIAGFWDGRDIDIRQRVGLIETDEQAERARADRVNDRAVLINRLVEDGLLPPAQALPTPAALRGAVHGFLCRTPAQLVGLSLDDLAGELDPVNVPGVGPETHPSWTRKMRDSIETLALSADVAQALRCEGRGHRV